MQTHWNHPDTVPPAAAWDHRVAPGIWLGGGQRGFHDQTAAREDLGSGLKLAILLDGAFELGVAGGSPVPVTGASTSLFVSRDPWQLDHSFARGSRLHYLTLFLEAGLIEDLLEQDLTLCAGGVRHATRATPAVMAGITARILHRPFVGVAGRLHDSAKALELAALALDLLMPDRPQTTGSIASPVEIRRLHELHAFLAEAWHETPPLDQLARRFGFSAKRMTAGFRRLFGCSIAQHLREMRLREAWRLIDAGMSATQAAEHTGYTLPHFTQAFTRRFGVTPGRAGQKSEKADRRS